MHMVSDLIDHTTPSWREEVVRNVFFLMDAYLMLTQTKFEREGWLLLGNVAWKTKKILRTRKIYPWRCIAMRGGEHLHTLEDR